MSVIHEKNDYVFIDHRNYSIKLYENVEQQNECDRYSYSLSERLFTINRNKKRSNRKRKVENHEVHEESMKIKDMYLQFINKMPGEIKNRNPKNELSTSDVRDIAQQFFESTSFTHKGIQGGNTSDEPLKCRINDEDFLIPSKSRFLCGCVKEQTLKLNGCKFDLLIADPPWWNKYIRRLKNANEKLSYSMMYNEDIASIPVRELLASNCLVAVWCTNAPSNISAVKDIIFPKWGVEYITTWYWLKVTTDLELFCDFGTGSEKQPYERIMLGKVGDIDVPETKLIISVPSALHSHKPPLLELLSPYTKSSDPNTLELFARYLLPNTTSIGYEPLKWQHVSLYDKIS